MIKDRVPLFCNVCGGRHLASQCISKNAPISNAPLETPSHNGEYQGDRSKIRVIPPGVFGSDNESWGKMARVAAERGREKQSVRASEVPRRPCAHCKSKENGWTDAQKKQLHGKGACQKFCCLTCQRKFYRAEKDKRAKEGLHERKTKWG